MPLLARDISGSTRPRAISPFTSGGLLLACEFALAYSYKAACGITAAASMPLLAQDIVGSMHPWGISLFTSGQSQSADFCPTSAC